MVYIQQLINKKKIKYYIGIVLIMSQTFSVVVHKEKKYYVAECPEVGTVSQGKTIEVTSKPFISFFEVTSYDKASKVARV